MIAFVPHILDDGAAARNERLDLLRGLIETYKRKQWGWLWTEGYAHPKLDENLGVSSYPSMVVVNPRKNVSVKMTTGFHKKGVEEFMRNVAYGKTAGAVVSTFEKFPELSKVDEWDGKDGEVIEEVNILNFRDWYYSAVWPFDNGKILSNPNPKKPKSYNFE